MDLYLECNSGISGDMAVAALIDAGADMDALSKALDSIPANGFRTEFSRANKNGISVADFKVILDHDNHDCDMDYLFGDSDGSGREHSHHHEHRGISEIFGIIDGASMADSAKNLAKKIFSIIAEAESKAHGVPKEEVHFHEVGALDSIVDVIALSVCFDSLGVERVFVPRLVEGSGTIRCQHGILSVPVPAVANILAEHPIPLCIKSERGEFVTPTGAAFAAAVRTDTSLPENFTVKKIGMGGGKRKYKTPSVLRAFLIETEPETETDFIVKLETNIDDCAGEAMGFAMERLFECGALDVNFIPCFMKKNRPAYILNVVCLPGDASRLESVIFENTTTIGIRRQRLSRTKLARSSISVQTEFGAVAAKEVAVNGKKRIYPEYESVRKICADNKISYAEAQEKILSSIKALENSES